jgi:murein DD-endopeptidase MepM/ murein hydrolase activator NlpD
MPRAHFLLLLGSLVLPCAPLAAQVQSRGNGEPVAATEGPILSHAPSRPGFGSFVRLSIRRANREGDSLASVSGVMAGEPLHFFEDADGNLEAFGPIPIEASDSVVARVELLYASGVADTLREVLDFPHRPDPTVVARSRARRLRVSQVYSAPPDAMTEARIQRENEEARAIGRRAHGTPKLWSNPFLRPRSSRITSSFGAGRLFNGRVASSHGGVDFAGKPGDPVRAANRGVVALVANFFLAGNVVYIDHGLGVVTGYFHLTEATVAVGDTVERGQEIGLVGASGRVTGPHLHWSARYGGYTLDPMGLVALTAPRATPKGGAANTPARPVPGAR